jgi:hypothetical protein
LLSAVPVHNYGGSIKRWGQAHQLGGGCRPAKISVVANRRKIGNPRHHSIAPFQNSRIGRDQTSARGAVATAKLLISLVGPAELPLKAETGV